MRKLIIGIVCCLLSFSCIQDQDDELSLLGRWVETAPVEGRTELFFIDHRTLSRSTGSGSVSDYFYKIEDGFIFLRPEGTEEFPETGLSFERIGEHTLKIENLYPSIPESEAGFIILERQ